MKATLGIITTFIMASSAFAALPPYWASVGKIETVMRSINDFSYTIKKIEEMDNLTYRVTTTRCSAIVKLSIEIPTHDDGREIPGPANYRLEEVIYENCD